MNNANLQIFNAAQTARLLDFADMVHEIKQASLELAKGTLQAPERQAVTYPDGGIMLSMPATAADIGIHKLVNVMINNAERNLPTIHGVVSAFDGQTGKELFILHGQTVTARRTAAVSMVGLDLFLPQLPEHITLIGYGHQAIGHINAIARLYPGIKVTITGRNPDKAQAFAKAHKHLNLDLSAANNIPDTSNAVITVTSSLNAVYNENATSGRLIIGVGAFRPDMAEVGTNTINGSQVYVDEPIGALHEAGDLIQANVDWQQVQSIANAVQNGVNTSKPIFYKTVGSAAWDLAATRAALKKLKSA